MDLQTSRPERKRKASIISQVIIALLLVLSLGAPAMASTDLETVYHVYMDEEYIGTVTDTGIVDKAVADIIRHAKQTFPNYDLTLGNDLTYIKEQVFRSNAENDGVRKEITKRATIEAKVIAITNEDEDVLAYVKDSEEAESTLDQVKEDFVGKEDWKNYQASLESDKELPALKKDESRIKSITIKEKLAYEDTQVAPSKVVSTKEAAKLIKQGKKEQAVHVVKEGEALEIIADEYQLDIDELKSLNEGITEESILQIGQELQTLVTKPFLHVIVERDLFTEEVVPFEQEVKENGSIPKGENKVIQEGKNGESAILYSVIEENGVQVKKEIVEETVITTPVKQITEKGTKVIPSRGSGTFAWPASGGYVSSKMGHRWGKLHKGIDIARPSNYTIKAADHGVVVSAGWDSSGYGNKIVIDHQNGYRTVYAHLKSIGVSVGQKVEKGSSIGVMGSTGHSTGTHLHFEVYKNGALKNPLDYL